MKNYNIPRSMSVAVNIHDVEPFGFGDETPKRYRIVVYADDPKSGGVQDHWVLDRGYLPVELEEEWAHEDKWLFYGEALAFLSQPEIKEALENETDTGD